MKRKLLILSLTVLTVACSKERATEAPRLDAPDRGGYSLKTVPAAAMVSASSGPIKLSLSMPATHYNAEKGSIWVKYTITNVGGEPFLVIDPSFHFGPISLMRGIGYFVEIEDAQGRQAAFTRGTDHPPPRRCWPEIFRVPELERYQRLAFTLGVGKSTSTAAVAFQTLMDAWCRKRPPPKPIGDFGEIKTVILFPGKYRIRAVYEKAPDLEITPQGEERPEQVTVHTPWIEFEASP